MEGDKFGYPGRQVFVPVERSAEQFLDAAMFCPLGSLGVLIREGKLETMPVFPRWGYGTYPRKRVAWQAQM